MPSNGADNQVPGQARIRKRGTGRHARRAPRIESVLLSDEPYRPMRPYQPAQMTDPAVPPGHRAAAYPGETPPLPPRRAVRRVPAPPAPGPGVRHPVAPDQQGPRPMAPGQRVTRPMPQALTAPRPPILRLTAPDQRAPYPMPPRPAAPRPSAPGPDAAWPDAGQWREVPNGDRSGPYRQGSAGRRLPNPTVPQRRWPVHSGSAGYLNSQVSVSRSPPGLYGELAQLEALGLELIEVRRVP
jgi:hypothetical protein